MHHEAAIHAGLTQQLAYSWARTARRTHRLHSLGLEVREAGTQCGPGHLAGSATRHRAQ
jgi:hypothetical protein